MNPLFFGGFNLFTFFNKTKFFNAILKHGSLKTLKTFLQPIIKELDFNQTMILNHPSRNPKHL
ncbi:hypothetical protein HPHPH41_0092 [Helicobacter pylori Hp H-41]|nr:hypothetical protein HPHPH41_0092 [Helicobacter pylori Hp H-41]